VTSKILGLAALATLGLIIWGLNGTELGKHWKDATGTTLVSIRSHEQTASVSPRAHDDVYSTPVAHRVDLAPSD
jgi:hypothetical protein